ncbi:hypothetical protein CALVIDRAFT_552688 [Calocera viscosa TUFC12733]|uniref:Uncharacterized protein n=1 Tax=Calocera viscosa (strain TUFC12733) TaxID=1330018 RepID=A0A167QYU8_CALVF|nr:hypothetical protein CALVIDRAFT_552688 [Calocera viscosa TUFC12733]
MDPSAPPLTLAMLKQKKGEQFQLEQEQAREGERGQSVFPPPIATLEPEDSDDEGTGEEGEAEEDTNRRGRETAYAPPARLPYPFTPGAPTAAAAAAQRQPTITTATTSSAQVPGRAQFPPSQRPFIPRPTPTVASASQQAPVSQYPLQPPSPPPQPQLQPSTSTTNPPATGGHAQFPPSQRPFLPRPISSSSQAVPSHPPAVPPPAPHPSSSVSSTNAPNRPPVSQYPLGPSSPSPPPHPQPQAQPRPAYTPYTPYTPPSSGAFPLVPSSSSSSSLSAPGLAPSTSTGTGTGAGILPSTGTSPNIPLGAIPLGVGTSTSAGPAASLSSAALQTHYTQLLQQKQQLLQEQQNFLQKEEQRRRQQDVQQQRQNVQEEEEELSQRQQEVLQQQQQILQHRMQQLERLLKRKPGLSVQIPLAPQPPAPPGQAGQGSRPSTGGEGEAVARSASGPGSATGSGAAVGLGFRIGLGLNFDLGQGQQVGQGGQGGQQGQGQRRGQQQGQQGQQGQQQGQQQTPVQERQTPVQERQERLLIAFPPDLVLAKNDETFRRLYFDLYKQGEARRTMEQLVSFFKDQRGWYFQSLPWLVALIEQAVRAWTCFKLHDQGQYSSLLGQLHTRLTQLMDSLAAHSSLLNPSAPSAHTSPAASFPPPMRAELWRRAEDARAAWNELNSRFEGGPQRAALILRQSALATFAFCDQPMAPGWDVTREMPLAVAVGPFMDVVSLRARVEEERFVQTQAQAQAQMHAQAQMISGPGSGPRFSAGSARSQSRHSSVNSHSPLFTHSPFSFHGQSVSPPSANRLPQQAYQLPGPVTFRQPSTPLATPQQQQFARAQQQQTRQQAQTQARNTLPQQRPTQVQLSREEYEQLQRVKQAEAEESHRRHLQERTAPGPLVDVMGRPEPPLPPSVFRSVSAGGEQAGPQMGVFNSVPRRASQPQASGNRSVNQSGSQLPSVLGHPVQSPSEMQYFFTPPITVNPSQSPEALLPGLRAVQSEEEARKAAEERRKRLDARKRRDSRKGSDMIDLVTPSPPRVKVKGELDEKNPRVKQEARDEPMPESAQQARRASDPSDPSPTGSNQESNLLCLTLGAPAIVPAGGSDDSMEPPVEVTDSPPVAPVPPTREEPWSIWNEPLLPVLRNFMQMQQPDASDEDINGHLGNISREAFEAVKLNMAQMGIEESDALIAAVAAAEGRAAQEEPLHETPDVEDQIMEDADPVAEVAKGEETLTMEEAPTRVRTPPLPPSQDDTPPEADLPTEPISFPESEEENSDTDMQVDEPPSSSGSLASEMSPLTPVPVEEMDDEHGHLASAAGPNGFDYASDSENDQQQVELAVAGSSTAGPSEPPETPPELSLHSSSATPYPESGPHTERTGDGRCKDCVAIMQDEEMILATEDGRFPKFPMPESQSEKWYSYEWENGPPEPGRAQWNWVFLVTEEEAAAAHRWAQRFDGFDPHASHLVFQLGVYDAQEVMQRITQQQEDNEPTDLSGIPCSFPESGLYGTLNDSTDHKYGISLFRHEGTVAIDLSAAIFAGVNVMKLNASKLWDDKTIILERRWPSEEEWNKTVEWYHRGEKMLLDHVSTLWNLKTDPDDGTLDTSEGNESNLPSRRWWDQYHGKTPIMGGPAH